MKRIVLLAGSSHTGKTALAQQILERYGYPYLSIDHLKMGLIRSGYCSLTPESDDKELTAYLWPVVREIIKTAIENRQRLVIEGCYIPFDYPCSFEKEYLDEIQFVCLCFQRSYIEEHFDVIQSFANVIEQRIDDSAWTKEQLLRENEENLRLCQKFGRSYLLLKEPYSIDLDLLEGTI